ncbi:MAG TPA: MarR family transcriptional regulator [Sphingobium sp.]
MTTMVSDVLAELPGYVLQRAANAMLADLTGRLAEIDVRISDAAVLMQIAGNSDPTSSEIGRVLTIQRANMAPLLARLDKAGWIRRSPLDRKSSALLLTEEGQAKLEAIRAIITRFEGDLMARIPQEHRSHFMPALYALWDRPI